MFYQIPPNQEVITAAEQFFTTLPQEEFGKIFTKWQGKMDLYLRVRGATLKKNILLMGGDDDSGE